MFEESRFFGLAVCLFLCYAGLLHAMAAEDSSSACQDCQTSLRPFLEEVLLAKGAVDRANARSDSVSHFTFRVYGEIRGRDDTSLLLSGLAISSDENYIKPGAVTREGNIRVYGIIEKEIYGNYYGIDEPVLYKYLYRDQGVNVFGAPVPIYVYILANNLTDSLEVSVRRAVSFWKEETTQYLNQVEVLVRNFLSVEDSLSAKQLYLSTINNNNLEKSRREGWELPMGKIVKIHPLEIETGVLEEDFIRKGQD